MLKKFSLPLAVALFTIFILSFVQIKVERPMLMAERFMEGAGWIEILLIAAYGAFVAYKMQDKKNVPVWRRRIWFLFAVVFFGQLALGLAGQTIFLMTGKLHLPIPMMILGGPVYRGDIGFMTILFLSTIVLTGPAWCSHLCYFGAFDSVASSGKTRREPLKNKLALKSTIILLVIVAAIILRFSGVSVVYATIIAGLFGIAGIAVMIFFSRRSGRMVHCVIYCPIGTLVNVLKFANPFRMTITSTCTLCMRCTPACKYDALEPEHIRNGKPGISCTLCGDCLASCRDNSIEYRFLWMNTGNARWLFLFLTISAHAVFLALARI